MIYMQTQNELKNRLSDYKIDGDINDLLNVLFTNSLVLTTINDLLSALSNENTNYIRIGYGQTLNHAYKTGYVVGKTCRLVHIYFYPDKINFYDLYNFIKSMNDGIIFGYSKDDLKSPGVKLVMIFN